jgi:hypothetical protein
VVKLGCYWVILGSFWDHFRIILGSFWGHFGHTWDHFGIILGSFWVHFGIISGHFTRKRTPKRPKMTHIRISKKLARKWQPNPNKFPRGPNISLVTERESP